MNKYEPQSSYFSKVQYSLHCMVKHNGEQQSMHTYLYHLSDVTCRNHAFTGTVADHISLETPPNIVRFKSDNSSIQYKSKYVFCYWQTLAKELNTKFLIY